jgi:hypothetical protein
MSFKIAKRGRPSKAEIAARTASAPKFRSDSEILTDLKERFDILSLLTRGAVARNVRAMVVTGAPGVGKTYTVEQILANGDVPHEIVRGSMSAINLYMTAYQYRKAGSVIVLDDADSIFNDEEALNILKALCDTSSTRKVSYMKEAQQLKEAEIPKSFEFDGAMIFISNLDFQKFVDEGKNKYSQHFEALMSRSLYLDLRLHTRAELGVWVNHIAKAGKIFERENVPAVLVPQILSFLDANRESLRELSIRTLMKLCQMAKSQPSSWERMARVLLLRH